MNKNIVILTLFSLVFAPATLPTPPTQTATITIPAPTKRPATKKPSNTLTRTTSFQEFATLHKKRPNLELQPQAPQQHKISPVAIPVTIVKLQNPVKEPKTKKYDFAAEWKKFTNRPRNPMPDPRKTPFKV